MPRSCSGSTSRSARHRSDGRTDVVSIPAERGGSIRFGRVFSILDKNVGGLDRTGRLIVGGIVILVALASFAGFYELGLGIGLAAILV